MMLGAAKQRRLSLQYAVGRSIDTTCMPGVCINMIGIMFYLPVCQASAGGPQGPGSGKWISSITAPRAATDSPKAAARLLRPRLGDSVELQMAAKAFHPLPPPRRVHTVQSLPMAPCLGQSIEPETSSKDN